MTHSSLGEVESQHGWRRFWRYSRALLAPLLIWGLLAALLVQPLGEWLRGEDAYDNAAMREWIEEARNADSTLADLVQKYEALARQYQQVRQQLDAVQSRGLPQERALEEELFQRVQKLQIPLVVKKQEIYQHLRALAEPATKMYPGQLPLFPIIYSLQVEFHSSALTTSAEEDDGDLRLGEPIVWDSGLEATSGQGRTIALPLRAGTGSVSNKIIAIVKVNYQLRAWNKRQRDELVKASRFRQLTLLAVAATILGVAWLMLLQADERDAQRQRELARERVDQAERQRLEEERRRMETESKLLEQRLATQAAEQQALELKSHLYASIGIMAGSYAHNIKNLLVRPNDLLRRCLERSVGEQQGMLREVQQTLGTVTERLQQILHTVRRDPSRAELKLLDLNAIVAATARTWGELAADRWHLDLIVQTNADPLWIEADDSHLHQAIENLLFNARDATFEMRNHHRDQARHQPNLSANERRQALIAAASWRGRVVLRTQQLAEQILLEVADNGAGMTEEVRQRCTETHFSTKRDNALYEGHSTGMGLGLSFVVAILESHQAKLEIESVPLHGTTFRIYFSPSKRIANG